MLSTLHTADRLSDKQIIIQSSNGLGQLQRFVCLEEQGHVNVGDKRHHIRTLKARKAAKAAPVSIRELLWLLTDGWAASEAWYHGNHALFVLGSPITSGVCPQFTAGSLHSAIN